jgi:ferredoxin-NADP reductase
MLGKKFINILSDEEVNGYGHGYITEEFLKSSVTDLHKKIYLCGPDPMMEVVEKHLSNLGVKAKSIIKEEF